MKNAFLRKQSRFLQRDVGAKRRRTSARRYQGEQLEQRAMLAGDAFNAYHNVDMPSDVSGDGRVTINDALAVVSDLRTNGSRQLGLPLARGGGEGEGPGQLFLDVNGDEMLTLGDALDVVSDLRSEGEGVAMDDFPVVQENSSNNQLDVLDNDQSDPGDTLTINQLLLSVDGELVTEAGEDTVVTSESGGEFRIANGRQSIFYTPRPGFFGEESLAYELNDGNGGLTTATVVVEVDPVNAAVRYRLEASSSVGGPALTDIDQGDNFFLNVYVQDIRADLMDNSIQGLEQGALDVLFDTTFVTLNDTSVSELEFGSNFTEFQQANFSNPGEINEVAASRNFFTDPPPPPLGNGEFLLFSASFTADTAGAALFSGNHPEGAQSETLVTNPTGGTNIFSPTNTPAEDFFVLEFVGDTLTINPSGFAMSDTATVNEDSGATPIPVLANDTELPGATLAIDSVTQPANGTTSIDDNGTPGDTSDDVVLYTPDADFAGTDTFMYTASDGLVPGNTDMATVTVTVNEQNDDPTAVNDTFSVTFNAPQQSLDVLANDSTDPDDDSLETLTVLSVNDTSTSGTVTVAAGGGAVNYTPQAGMFTTDTFTYTISDGRGGTDTATVTINGVAFDDVVAIRLEPSQTQIDEGDTVTVNVFIEDLRNDPTIDLGVFQAYVDLNFDASILTPVAGADGNIIDFNGPYEQLDPPPIFVSGEIQNVGGFHPGLVSSMGLPNGGDEFLFFSVDFMAIGNGTADVFTMETTNQGVFGIELADDTGSETPVDPDDVDFGMTQVVVNPPVFDTDLVVSVQAVDPITGAPVSAVSVGDTFEVRLSVRDTRETTPNPEGFPGVLSAYFDLLVAELGDAVSAVPGSFENGPNYTFFTLPGTPVPGTGIDDVGAGLALSVVQGNTQFDGNQPQLVFSYDFTATGLGEVVFQSASTSTDDLPLEFVDPEGQIPTTEITFGSATVFVADANAPTAASDSFTTFQNNALTIVAPGVLANDTDPNGDTLTASLQAGASNGSVVLNADGSFTYTPAPGFVGNDTFTYRAVDSTGLESNTAIVRISVTPVAALEANADVFTTPLNTTLDVAAPGVLANDVGQGLTASLDTDASNGTLTLNANGSFSYEPNTNFTGIDSFTYVATDASGSQQTATVTIGVGITPASLSGRVYIDSNINGIYEPDMGELAIGNAEVMVTGSAFGSGTFFQTTVTTDAAGQYTLPALLPGNYTIVEPIPEFLLSGTVTVNGVVDTNTAADLDSFTAFEVLTGGESTVVNFGHMGIHPEFLSYRDISARTPRTGAYIANDPDGNNLWYALLPGFEGVTDADLDVSDDRLFAELNVLTGSGSQSITLDTTGPSRFRVMGTRPDEGTLYRVEGSLAEAVAGEGEADLAALDALMAEGFE